MGREGARINRRAQLFPAMPHGTNVILMRMGDENRLQPVTSLFQPRDIRQDQIYPRRAIHIRKGHAQIDKDQAFLVGFAIPVYIGIHANFACPAQGQINDPFTAHDLSVCLVIGVDDGQPVHRHIVFQRIK